MCHRTADNGFMTVVYSPLSMDFVGPTG